MPHFCQGAAFFVIDRKVLLFSGDREIAGQVRGALEPMGYRVTHRQRLPAALNAMAGSELVILDVPDVSAGLREVKSYHPEATVLVLGHGGCMTLAVEEGAYDCLEKPLALSRLILTVRNAFRYMGLAEELGRVRSQRVPRFISHKNARMHKAIRQIGRAAGKDTPVLVTGEQGAGKWRVTRMLHLGGPRRSGPFVHVERTKDMETRLFGTPGRPGALFEADGGTLVVEDVAGLPEGLRDRLGAFIRERAVSPEGGSEPVPLDVRVVCVAESLERDDPLLKNFAVEIKIPPLRERREDILPLAEHFLAEAARQFRCGPRALTAEARRLVSRYRWPGNAWELQNTMRRACLLAQGPDVDAAHLGLAPGAGNGSVKEFLEGKLKRHIQRSARVGATGLYGTVMGEVEKSLIELVLQETGGNQVRAAGALGINRATLRTKIRTYRIRTS
jgi:DNA-binding NtrC family response regulator